MKTAMMAASGRRLSSWRRHVKIDLDIQSNRVVNKVTGEQAVIPAGMTYSTLNGKNVAVFTSSVVGGIQLAHNPAFAPGNGDFTIEVLFDADGIWTEPADNSQSIPFLMWGTWAAPGQSVQMDALYNHKNGGGVRLGKYESSVGSYVSSDGLGVIDQSIVTHFVFQRKAGVVTVYRNGVLIQTTPYTQALTGTVNSPFRIMSRRGGGSGEVWWRFIGKLIGFRMTHAAIYNGPFTPPASF